MRFFNHAQAVAVLPWLWGMLALSALWWVLQRAGAIRASWWVDAIGSVANLVGVAIVLHLSWNMNCAVIAWLIMASITIGARYTTPWFVLSIAASTAVTYFAAPANYWGDRPYFALFTFLLVIGLPLSVYRLLQTMRVVTEAAIRARDAHSRFVATISHELRTPLNSVVNATEMIEGENDPVRRERLIDLLISNATALRNRVNAVLDVRAIETGRMLLADEPFILNDVIATLSNVLAQSAAEKKITLAMTAGSAGEIVLRSDPARIEQVLTNLLSNAIKFTPAGGLVELTISTPGADADGRVLIEAIVADTGIGIPDAAKANVFDPYYQVSSGSTRHVDGIGLGLHIVKNITRVMEGDVSVEDNAGGGSVFRWRVPLRRAAPSEKPSRVQAFKTAVIEHKKRVRPLHVLVIDDNASNREIAKGILTMAGHRMSAATNGADGLAQIESTLFDLVILDLHMPGMSGTQMLGRLHAMRAVSITPTPPIVFLSADATPESMSEARRLGAIGYLMKPISATRLLNILEDVSSGHTPEESLSVVDIEPNAAPAKAYESFLDYLRADGNAVAIARFVRTCLDGIDGQLASLTISLAAGEVEQSSHHLHCLKNEFLQLGEKEGVECCTRLRAELHDNLDAAHDLEPLVQLANAVKRRAEAYTFAVPESVVAG